MEIGRGTGDISVTLLRKSVTTQVRARVPQAREALAAHMSHQPKTADKFYDLYDRGAVAPTVSRVMSTMMEGGNRHSETDARPAAITAAESSDDDNKQTPPFITVGGAPRGG